MSVFFRKYLADNKLKIHDVIRITGYSKPVVEGLAKDWELSLSDATLKDISNKLQFTPEQEIEFRVGYYSLGRRYVKFKMDDLPRSKKPLVGYLKCALDSLSEEDCLKVQDYLLGLLKPQAKAD